MKIILPKTLAEPVGIPWGQISLHGDTKAASIHKALSEHMKYHRKYGRVSYDEDISLEISLICLRAIVRKGGGRFPVAHHEQSETDHLYTVHYQINRKCYKYSILISLNRS